MSKHKPKKPRRQVLDTPGPEKPKRTNGILGMILFLFAFVLYAQSIAFDFALDDYVVIVENNVTTQGIQAVPTIMASDYWYGYEDMYRGAIYRPTSRIVFAVIWEFFRDNAHVYHFFNVLAYAITCLVLFRLLLMLFENRGRVFAFIAAILFAAHPVHTEVVNNIKSLDEILTLLFGITSILFFLRYLSDKSKWSLVIAGFSFFLSLLSKETGITFLVIIPLAIYFFSATSWRRILRLSTVLIGITAVYLVIRSIVVKDIDQSTAVTLSVLNNALNAAPDLSTRMATVFFILLKYVQLLVFPHPLTCDYNYAQIPLQSITSPGAISGLLLYVALGVFAVVSFRKKNVVAFGILFFIMTISPVSNVLFLSGSTMAERFLYTPSLGFVIILTYLLFRFLAPGKGQARYDGLRIFAKKAPLLFLLTVLTVGLYSFKTLDRSRYWEDNLTLFSRDANTSSNSARANKIYGSSLFKSAQDTRNESEKERKFRTAKFYLRRALDIYASYNSPMDLLGIIYYLEGSYDSAYYFQSRLLELEKDDADLYQNTGKTLNKLRRYDEAISVSSQAIVLDPENVGAYYNLALAYTNKGDLENGLSSFLKVIELDPARGDAQYYTGRIYEFMGDTAKAREHLERARALGNTE